MFFISSPLDGQDHESGLRHNPLIEIIYLIQRFHKRRPELSFRESDLRISPVSRGAKLHKEKNIHETKPKKNPGFASSRSRILECNVAYIATHSGIAMFTYELNDKIKCQMPNSIAGIEPCTTLLAVIRSFLTLLAVLGPIRNKHGISLVARASDSNA